MARFNHVPGGCNILYMDGHVQFNKLNQGYPTQTEFPAQSLAGTIPTDFASGNFWIRNLSWLGGG